MEMIYNNCVVGNCTVKHNCVEVSFNYVRSFPGYRLTKDSAKRAAEIGILQRLEETLNGSTEYLDEEEEKPSDQDSVFMFDLDGRNKKLILHAAYYAVVVHDWRDEVTRAKIDFTVKQDLVGKFPSGDPLNNLLNLAGRLLPDFDDTLPISKVIDKIKKFIYGT
jgi:hypothetical protein